MYLIDGNNLIGHSRKLSLEDLNCRQNLIDILTPFLSWKKRQTIVFFDGREELLQKTKYIEIRFSGSKTADELIRETIERSSSPKNICVVSSDNEVYNHAKRYGVGVLKCYEFNRFLNEIRDEPEPLEVTMSEEDIRYWSDYFGTENVSITDREQLKSSEEGISAKDLKDWKRYCEEEQ